MYRENAIFDNLLYSRQVSAVAGELARHDASRPSCCQQRWTLCDKLLPVVGRTKKKKKEEEEEEEYSFIKSLTERNETH